ncbi:MAG: translocation/assembly module TamB domain-containing protein [Polyangiales bacterium]
MLKFSPPELSWRVLKALLAFVLLLGVMATSLLVTTWAHIDTAPAKRLVATLVREVASAEMAGSIDIGAIVRLHPSALEARDFRLFDPHGRQVGHVRRVWLRFDLAALSRGLVRVAKADGRGGWLRLIPGEDGVLPTFIDAFAAARPATTLDPGATVPVHLDNMRLTKLHVSGELLGLKGIVIPRLDVHGRVEIEEMIHVHFARADGKLTQPFPFQPRLAQLSGDIHTDPRRGIRLHAVATHAGDRVSALVYYGLPTGAAADAPSILSLRLHAQPLRAERLADVGFIWAKAFAGRLRGHAHLWGPVDGLRVDGWFHVERGHVNVHARFAPDGATQVHGQVRALSLDKLIRDGPALRLSGTGRLQVPADGTAPKARLKIAPLSAFGISLPAIELEATLQQELLQLRRVRSRYPGTFATGRGRIDHDGRLSFQLSLRSRQIARDVHLRRFVPSLRAGLRLKVQLQGSVWQANRLRVDTQVDLEQLRYGSVSAQHVRLDGQLRGDLRQPQVVLTARTTALSLSDYPVGSGTIKVRGGPTQYNTTLDLGTQAGRRFALTAQLQREDRGYRFDAPQAVLSVGAHQWRGWVRDFVWHPQRGMKLEQLRLASGSQRLEASGHLPQHGERAVTAQLQNFDLRALHALFGAHMPPIYGHADLYMALRGDENAPHAQLSGSLRDGRAYGVQDIQASYIVDYRLDKVRLDASITTPQHGALSLRGHGDLDPQHTAPDAALAEGIYDLDAELHDLDLRLLRQLEGVSWPAVQGKVRGTLSLVGALSTPSFEADFRIPNLRFAGWPELHVHSRSSYAMGAFGSHLRVGHERGPLLESEASLLVDLPSFVQDPQTLLDVLDVLPWRIAVRLPAQRLQDLPEPVAVWLPPVLGPVRVALSASLSGGGFVPKGDLWATASWDEDLGGLPCGGASGQARAFINAQLRQGISQLTVSTFLQERSVLELTAKANTPVATWIEAPQRIALPAVDIEGKLRNLRLEQLPWLCEHAQGAVTGALYVHDLLGPHPVAELQLHSKRARMRRVWVDRRRLVLQPMQVATTPPLRLNLQARVDGERARARVQARWPEAARAELRAQAPSTWKAGQLWPTLGSGQGFDLRLGLHRAPLPALITWVPHIVRSSGEISGQLRARSRAKSLPVHGSLRLSDGTVQLRGIGHRLRALGGDVNFHGNWVQLRNLRAEDGRGQLRIDGSIGLQEWPALRTNLQLQARRFPVRREGAVLGRLSGHADLKAHVDAETTDADVRLRRLQVRLPEASTRTLQDLDIHPDVRLRRRRSVADIETGYRFVAHIDATQPFWVSRPDFAAQVSADLNVEYIDPDLRVSGYADIRRGFLDVFGKRFEVERGTLSFDGGRNINPAVNLVVQHELTSPPGAVVTVQVTGTLQRPNLDFRSNVTSDRAETIALLVSGQRGSQSLQSQSAAQTEQQVGQQAASFLSGLTAGLLTLTARREFGDVIPIIAIESSSNAYGQSTRAKVGYSADSIIPKRLSRIVQGAYVETSAGTGTMVGPNTGSTGAPRGRNVGFLIELQFPHNLVGSGAYGPPDNWGIDLTWEP